ncbi:Brix domain-containing protein [Fomitopsis serialis]|uniref:Brix domain-containing protein n=1 Tax=Fomitopsis serialis TaxID=139415 RepID=UPI002008C254|nr:Brix domain-containing protein [Neoantrodia serialis]KAH9921011.1 Brix domain-containing protein [Neoantrodia serialis]
MWHVIASGGSEMAIDSVFDCKFSPATAPAHLLLLAMLRTIKPKNARSKRALQAREPKEVEDARTAIFVKGTHTGEKVNAVMKELNAVRPFEDASSLDFWAKKNDASLFVRPDGLVFVRMYDERVLDMCEVGVEKWISMNEFKVHTEGHPGHKPLMHFASELFDTHPRFVQLKSLLLDFFNGEAIDSICLAGLEHVISVSLGPTPASLNTTATSNPLLTSTSTSSASSSADLPTVHVRVYNVKLLASGTRIPRVELTDMGPSMDLVLRRHTEPDSELLKQALRRPKLRKQEVEKGLGKKRKNMEVDEMGDLRGRIHVAKQDLSKLQTRKMKGLKKGGGETFDESGESGGEEEEVVRVDAQSRKRRKIS